MKTEKKEIASTATELKIILEKDEVEKLYNKTVKYFKNKYQIPGFRKGKAPVSLVKKMFKEAINASFELAAYDEFVNLGIAKENEQPITEPELVSNKWLENNEYELTVKYEKMPDIDIKKYKNLEVEYVEEKFKDELLEEQLQSLQRNYTTETRIEENIQENDNISLEFYENKDSEAPVFILENIIYRKENFPEEFNNFLSSAKVGDSIKLKLDLKNISSNPPEKYNEDKIYVIKIKSAKRINKPEINDEFAKDLNFDTLEALKDNIKKELEKQIKEKNLESKLTAVTIKIIEENPFDIPKTMIDKYSYELASNYVQTKENIQEIIPLFSSMAEFNIKSYYIKNDIVKKEKLEVTEKDLEEYNKKKAEELHLDLNKYLELYKSTIESKTYKDKILDEKFDKFLLENNKFIPVEKKEDDENNKSESVEEDKNQPKENNKEENKE